jgi:hypothetical protein
VFALPVQNSVYGVNSSALAEMSGASRHGVPVLASEQWVVPLPKVVPELMTPRPFWYDGLLCPCAAICRKMVFSAWA